MTIVTDPSLLLRVSTPVSSLEEGRAIVEQLLQVLAPSGKNDSFSAPCIGILKRVFLYRLDGVLHIVYNPAYFHQEGSINIVTEQCCSWPKTSMPRFSKIKACFFDEEFKPVEKILEGAEAIIFQHECDHLMGKHPSVHGYKKQENGTLVKEMGNLKVPRNSDCPCGSGKKYKKCCLLVRSTR